ncbi:hypothetical protein LG290_09030 [Halomonas sediminis]
MKVTELVKGRVSNLLARPVKERRYIDHSLGASGFLKRLKENNVNYVVLRWFEGLPEVAPGEDIDILVADEDIEILTSFVNNKKSRKGIPCDIYSVSGLSGTSWRGLSYYPVENARTILDNAVWLNDIVRVPSPDEHFLSLCFHAVYHKGYASGIPSHGGIFQEKVVDHDYQAELQRLFNNSSFKGSELEMTLEGLDGLLRQAGWRPAYDTLEKMSKANGWIHDELVSKRESIPDNLKGVTVFLVREEGMGYLDAIKRCIFEDGFDHLIEGSIPPADIQTIATGIRGGNWGKGPWKKSGGLPAYYFVAFDAKPLVPNAETMKEHVGLYNGRVMLAKRRIRELYNTGKPLLEQCNILHSTDNGAQAIDYLKLIDPGCLEYVDQETSRKCAAFATPFKVIEDLSHHARRAKVELVEFHGRKAICKTFKEGRRVYLEREVLAREVGKGVSEISDILEVGDNYIVMEFCDGSIEDISTLRPIFHGHGFLPIWAIKKIKSTILYYRSLGYECIDFGPHNILFDSKKGLKFIDFEFLEKVDTPSGTLKGNYAWYAVPADFEGDIPVGDSGPYRANWIGYTGLPLFFCVNDFPGYILHPVRFSAYFYISIRNLRKRVVYSSVTFIVSQGHSLVRKSRKLKSSLSQQTLRFR